MEQSFRRAYKIHDGDFRIFIGSPLCIILILLTVGVIFLPMIQKKIKQMKAAKAAAK